MLGEQNNGVQLRPVQDSDVGLLYLWRNLPEIIERSGSGLSVQQEEHQQWFSKALNDPSMLIFIIQNKDEPIGQIRFKLECSEKILSAVVSIFLIPGMEGKGFGSVALKNGCRAAFEKWPDLTCVKAEVLLSNIATMKFFEGASFRKLADSVSVTDESGLRETQEFNLYRDYFKIS